MESKYIHTLPLHKESDKSSVKRMSRRSPAWHRVGTDLHDTSWRRRNVLFPFLLSPFFAFKLVNVFDMVLLSTIQAWTFGAWPMRKGKNPLRLQYMSRWYDGFVRRNAMILGSLDGQCYAEWTRLCGQATCEREGWGEKYYSDGKKWDDGAMRGNPKMAVIVRQCWEIQIHLHWISQ